ncbi:MAG: hypothetical protein AAGI88_22290 [Pseudomonadota bacterium]
MPPILCGDPGDCVQSIEAAPINQDLAADSLVPPAATAKISATGLFIDGLTGNDQNDCRSHAKRCRSLTRINELNAPAGTDINLLAGTTLNCQAWKPRFSGESADNRVRFGAYHIVDGEPVQGRGLEGLPRLTYDGCDRSVAIDLNDGPDWIHIDEVQVDGMGGAFVSGAVPPQNLDHWIESMGAEGILVTDSRFDRARGYNCFDLGSGSSFVFDNVRADLCGSAEGLSPKSTSVQDIGDMVRSKYNTSVAILNSTWTRAGHNIANIEGSFFLSNSTFSNDWRSVFGGVRGNRIMVIRSNRSSGVMQLMELGPYGDPVDTNSAPYMKNLSSNNILRWNHMKSDVDSPFAGIRLACENSFTNALNNRIYQNHIENTSNIANLRTSHSECLDTSRVDGNVLKNNRLGPLASSGSLIRFQLTKNASTEEPFANNTLVGNCIEEENPVIEERANGSNGISLAEAESRFGRNFSDNQSGGRCQTADLGVDLARTVGSGTGSTIAVSDSGYFTGPIEIAGIQVYEGDRLSIEGNSVNVVSVDRSASTIRIDRSIDWSRDTAVNHDCDVVPDNSGVPDGCGVPGDPSTQPL